MIGNRNEIWASPLASAPLDGDEIPTNTLNENENASLEGSEEDELALEGELATYRLLPIVPYNMMLTMYSRLKNADKFVAILNRIHSAGIAPDIYTYNALFKLRANRGELELLLTLAVDMIQENIPLDVVSYNILIEALGAKGWAHVAPIGPFGGGSGIACAHRVLNLMSRQRIIREPRTYEVMFNALFKVDLCEEIVQLWSEMLQRGTLPTAEACSTVMKAYYRLGQPDHALAIWFRVKNILMDYIRHLEGTNSELIRTQAVPQFHKTALSPGSWDPLLPTARTENILLDIFKEQGQLTAFFETWHIFRRANINPLASSCAALMEVYLDLADFKSGLNVFEWLHLVKIQPSPRLLAAHISLIAYQSISKYEKASGLNYGTPQDMIIRPTSLDHGSLSIIRQEWMALRSMDSTFHPPQFSTFEAVIASFHFAQDYIGVFDAFKIMMEGLISRSPTARAAYLASIAAEEQNVADDKNNSPKQELEVKKEAQNFNSNSERSSEPKGPHKHHKNHHWGKMIRSIRHVPPLRGKFSIETLILVLDAHKRAKSWYGTDSKLLAQIELARQILGLEATQDYLFAKTLSVLDQPSAAPPDPEPESTEEPKSYADWKITSVGSTELLNSVKKATQPRFVPTSWNIAIQGPSNQKKTEPL